MVRPQKPEAERRSRTICVRVTTAETAEIAERAGAARLTKGGYIRRRALGQRGDRLATSAEVLQELLHYYHRDQRLRDMDDAFTLVENRVEEIWAAGKEDIETARNLVSSSPGLEARDLVHLACCIRRQPCELMTFDRGLAAAWQSRC